MNFCKGHKYQKDAYIYIISTLIQVHFRNLHLYMIGNKIKIDALMHG